MTAQNATRPIRIGLIGATSGRGWAGMAHVPAIRAVPGVSLHAVATRSAGSARAAAEAFDAPLWFADAGEMIAHSDVEAVVVAVKTSDHHGYAKQALLAGKPVYCEMPFTRTIDEARELAALARERGVTTAIGLQGRFSPWIRQIRDIVASGRLGRVLSTTMTCYDELSTGTIDQNNAYLLDAASGANPLTIHSAHNLDGVRFAVGEVSEVAALTAVSRPRVAVRQTGEILAATSPDQIAVAGRLIGGAVVSFHMRAGSGDPPVHWEIQGEKAVLRVTSRGYLMWRPLLIEMWDGAAKSWEALAPSLPLGEGEGVPGLDGSPAQFVASLYAAFAADIRTGSARSVTFAEALKLSEMVAAIQSAAEGGRTARPLDDAARSEGPVP